MLRLLVDTSVWLDLAQRRDGQKWIVPMRALINEGHLQLLVPALVIAEFDRSRPRVEGAVTAKVRERFRLLRHDLDAYVSDDRRREWLDEMTHHIPLVRSMTLQNFSEIAELLRGGRKLRATSLDHMRVVQRGLDKKAPLHFNKNSVADALLIELYASTVKRSRAKADEYWFVTSNHQDFSTANGDRRQPHPDLADIFADKRCRYILGGEGLKSAFEEYFGDYFFDLASETEFLQSEPRTFAEIIEAMEEYFDRVWYVRASFMLTRKTMTFRRKFVRGPRRPVSALRRSTDARTFGSQLAKAMTRRGNTVISAASWLHYAGSSATSGISWTPNPSFL